MGPLLAIARQTFTESLRQPAYTVLLAASVLLIHLQPEFAQYVFRAQTKLVTDAGLSVVLLSGWIAAAFCANRAINYEIESGTALLVLSKPVDRFTFLAAKFLGVGAAVLLFVATTGMALLITLQIAVDQFRYDVYVFYGSLIGYLAALGVGGWVNYFYRRSFTKPAAIGLFVVSLLGTIISGVLPKYSYGSYKGEATGHSPDIIMALLLVILAALAMGAIATALSTLLSVTANISCCLLIFFLGLVSDFLYGKAMSLAEADIAYTLYYWPLLLVPLVILCWFVIGIHFERRTRTDGRRWHLHTGVFLVVAACIARVVVVHAANVTSRPPEFAMALLAKPVAAGRSAVVSFLHAVIPNWQQFWMADALTAEHPIPFSYVLHAAFYALLVISATIIIAHLAFQAREIGAGSRS